MTALLRAKLSWRLDGAASHASRGASFSRACARVLLGNSPFGVATYA
jgi:hypothetical protein